MKRGVVGVAVVAGILLSFVLVAATRVRAHDDDDHDGGRVARGFRIAPVVLHFAREKREQVGLGSYLVNAVSVCADCHSCPTYAPGHNPYGPPFGPPGGGDGQLNATNYLAGGVQFAPPGVTSANLTPDLATHRPAGLSFTEFRQAIRTGHDPDNPSEILQVMPWPIFRNMKDEDLRAIYEYLRAIPHAEPGSCVAPGQ